MTTLDEALAEAEQIARIGREFAEYATTANAARRERWPNYCPACSGWGAKTLWDCCDALLPGTCHRCGQNGIDPESSYCPCQHCGWWYDGGMPVT
jgi:hypothetical protein